METPLSNTDLDNLLELYGDGLAGKVWRGNKAKEQAAKARNQVLKSGYSQLDEQLHERGWPLTTTTELGLSQAGIGELRLLIPALRQLQQTQQNKGQQNNIVLIAPPLLPFAPALLKEQIDASQVTIVQTNNLPDTLWAAEQALLAECCAAVLTWTGNANLSTRELRRLQLAAERTHTWNVLLRDSHCLKQSSASGLRIHLQTNTYSQLDLHIIKQPQGWGGQKCTLSLHPHYENWQRLPAHLLPHHNQIQIPALPAELNLLSSADQRQASVTVLTPLNALRAVH